MDITVKPGTYVVAVSGGVDSVVLLDLLAAQPGHTLVVAHFDHGIRPDSGIDRQHVQQLARQHHLPFTYHEGQLGPRASEATARRARYNFLTKVKDAMAADAIITAHHHDDVVETAIINLLRGTGQRGLSSLKNGNGLLRPLLHVSKQDIVNYAKSRQLPWREDSTNQDTTYLRNHIRHNVVPRFDEASRQKLDVILATQRTLSEAIEHEITNLLHQQPARNVLDRHWFTMLPHAVAKEIMAAWLRNNGITGYDSKTIERLIHAGKTYRAGRRADINRQTVLYVTAKTLALRSYDR